MSNARVNIDFFGGTHGNFLEFALNKVLLGDMISQTLPFDTRGASHTKSHEYISQRVVVSNHYSMPYHSGVTSNMIISVQINEDDLLPVSLVSLLRAGDGNIDPWLLEVDTFHKFNCGARRSFIEKLNTSFGSVQPYYDVKAHSWPDIKDASEFSSLPEPVRRECIEKYGIRIFYLDANSPNCPRSVLREFYKIGFRNPLQNGFITQQQLMKYSPESQVYVFPFSAFYSTEEFTRHIQRVVEFFQFPQTDYDLGALHLEFIKRQPFSNAKTQCDQIISDILNDIDVGIPLLTVLHEAYIDAMLERHTGRNVSNTDEEYTKTTGEMNKKWIK